ncbi:hypothetical protein [Halobellus ordinarius]|uniref:hypothetical protein n=1 Tax=Halobellus ordinarius TaxID=3075120 RepID=UPI00288010E1|nr:hypothetical protein [Halobellus sp. ZY16]
MSGRGDEDVADAYDSVRSVDTGSVVRSAVGDARIALGSVSGDVTLLSADAEESRRIRIGERPRGLAVDPLLYVGVNSRLQAYTLDGDPAWDATIAGAEALCSLPGDSIVLAATAAGEFVGLDAHDGSIRFRTDRKHAEVSDRIHLAGRDGRFLAGASWYLTVFDTGGRLRTEVDLDGAITAVGALDGLAVVALRGGRLAGVELATGEIQWTREREIDWLAPRGTGDLYASAGDRLLSLDAAGEVTVVNTFDAGESRREAGRRSGSRGRRMLVTTDGSLACRIDDTEAEVFRPTGSLPTVDLTVRDSTVGVGEAVTVDIESRGSSVRGDVRIESDDATFQPGSRAVRLDAEDETSVTFTLSDAAAGTATATVAFLEGGAPSAAQSPETRAAESLTVRGGQSPLAVETDCQAIENGTAVLEVTVRTEDGSELPRLTISPGEDVVPNPGQSSLTRTTSVPLDTDTIEIVPADAREPVSRAVTLPSEPLSLSIAAQAGFVDVRLSNEASVPITDWLSVSGDGLPDEFDRSVSLAPGAELTVAIPSLVDGRTEVRAETAVTAATTVVAVDRAALDDMNGAQADASQSATGPTADSAGGGERPDSTTDSSAEARDSATGRISDRSDHSSPASAASSASATESPSDAGSDRTAPATPTETGDGDPDTVAAETRDDFTAENRLTTPDPIDLSREFDADAVPQGHAVEETVTIDNVTTEQRSVTISSGGGTETIDVTVPAEQETRVLRYHAAWGTTPVPIPGITARTDEYETSLPETSVDVEPSPLVVRPVLSERATETDVHVAVRNDRDRSCSVVEIGSRGFSQSATFDDFEVPPDSIGYGTTTYEGAPAEDPSLTFVGIEGRKRPIRTLAPVRERAPVPVSVAVEAIDVLGERDTNVVLRVDNDGDVPLDVRVEANGDVPDEYLYSASTLAAIGPGESATHRIECTTDAEAIELPVEVVASLADDSTAGDNATGGEATAGDDGTGGEATAGDDGTGGKATAGDDGTGGKATAGDDGTGGKATAGDDGTDSDESAAESMTATLVVTGDRSADAAAWSVDAGDDPEATIEPTEPGTLSTPFERS